jgi:hypothetical protein
MSQSFVVPSMRSLSPRRSRFATTAKFAREDEDEAGGRRGRRPDIDLAEDDRRGLQISAGRER